MQKTDFLIIGGGIVGLCLALELKKQYTDQKIIILEKESFAGFHASGRNSGVLHAGFYYTSDSLKARFCRQGNLALTAYCEEKQLTINRCGKLIVATNEEELSQLDILYQRGLKNNVPLEMIDEQQANKIEPNAYTLGKALYSPSTSTVDPAEIMEQLLKDAESLGIHIRTGEQYLSTKAQTVTSDKGKYNYHYLINCAGLYADKIARQFGFCRNYSILPFKGLYLYSDTFRLNTNLYPVPNIQQPFLGTHFTVRFDGKVKIGPTAAPAFWREQYHYLQRYRFTESLETSAKLLKLWLKNSFQFRKLAITELQKLKKANMAKSAGRMLKNFDHREFDIWGKPGIRAQLINNQTDQLEMDYLFEGDDKSFHVLNAVSPAFTSSMPFAEYLVEEINSRIS